MSATVDVAPGRARSGRLWKEPAQRASSRVTIKTLHPGFNKRKEITQRQRQMKQVENELRQEREDTKKKIIEARKAKQQQQLANEKRGEVVQLITNVRKLKRLGKKQMRQIIERSL